MALVIETGSGIAGANSYCSVEEARAYAEARGLTLPAGDSAVEILLIQAADYLESLDSRYKGYRFDPSQALAWPRGGVYLYSSVSEIGGTVIPDKLKQAQAQLAVDANSVTLQPTGTGQEIIRRKVDVIETEFAPRGSGTVSPRLNKALAILEPLFNSSSSLSTIRA